MLSSSFDFDRHIGMLSSSFDFDRHIILWVRPAHRHAIIIFWFRQAHHLVSSTDTSTSLCSQNEDFGRPNKHLRTRFRSTFQRFVAKILFSRPWKVLRKRVRKCLFGLPKSSFGRGNLVSSTDTLSSSCDLDDNHDWIIMRSSLSHVANKKLRNFAPTT